MASQPRRPLVLERRILPVFYGLDMLYRIPSHVFLFVLLSLHNLFVRCRISVICPKHIITNPDTLNLSMFWHVVVLFVFYKIKYHIKSVIHFHFNFYLIMLHEQVNLFGDGDNADREIRK
jgi:hypothetical protein